MVHRHHGWVGFLVASLLWKLKCYLLVPWKLVLGEEAFRSEPSWVFWSLCLKHVVSPAIETYLLPLGVNTATAIVYNALGVSWISLSNNSKETFLFHMLGLLLDSLWSLQPWVGALSAQIGKCHLNSMCVSVYVCVHGYSLTCNYEYLSIVNSMLLS